MVCRAFGCDFGRKLAGVLSGFNGSEGLIRLARFLLHRVTEQSCEPMHSMVVLDLGPGQ